MADIDLEIELHVSSNLQKVEAALARRTDLKAQTEAAVAAETATLAAVNADAVNLLRSVKGASSRLQRSVASINLETNKGFSARISTRDLITGNTVRTTGKH